MRDYSELADLVQNGDADGVVSKIKELLAEGCSADDILNHGLVDALNELGERYRLGEVYVPEMLIASEAMKKGVEVVKPLLMQGEARSLGKCLFCTVEGDMHDIGKNLVILFMESAGFEIVDLGVDVDADTIVESIEEDESIQILGMSAMLTTTMYAMQDTIEALEDAGLRNRVKIMVGGAPVNQAFADKIGADGYSSSAPTAVELALRLISEK